MSSATHISLGLTGGIGSGKSYVAKVFRALGIPVYNSDEQAKALYYTDEGLKLDIINHFGEAVYPYGRFDPKRLSEIVFDHSAQLELLNQIVHPRVWSHFIRWTEEQPRNVPYVLFESAILLQIANQHTFTRILTISAQTSLRVKRACQRDFASEAEVYTRINRQWTDAQREAKADFVLISDNISPLLPRILQIHEQMVALHNH